MEPVVHDLSKQFHSKTLDEDRDETAKVISLRLNKDELAELRQFMDHLDTENEGRVIKILMRLGAKRLHEDFSAFDLRWMSRRDRSRGIGPKGN